MSGHRPFANLRAETDVSAEAREEIDAIKRVMDDVASTPAHTVDGQPITPTPPYGATIVVYRRAGLHWQYLLLHRAYHGPDFDGDWAWGPPSGARLPGEDFERCAQRELYEETGLQLPLQTLGTEPWDWLVYLAESANSTDIQLSLEHDRYDWLPRDQAIARVSPAEVRAQLVRAASLIEPHQPARET